VLSAPVVRVLCDQGVLLVESVPAFPARGEGRLDDDQRTALRAAGWLLPGDEGYVPVGGPDLRVYVPRGEAPRAAALAATTYRVLGVADPAVVEEERGS
jgi:hypothetical protein